MTRRIRREGGGRNILKITTTYPQRCNQKVAARRRPHLAKLVRYRGRMMEILRLASMAQPKLHRRIPQGTSEPIHRYLSCYSMRTIKDLE